MMPLAVALALGSRNRSLMRLFISAMAGFFVAGKYGHFFARRISGFDCGVGAVLVWKLGRKNRLNVVIASIDRRRSGYFARAGKLRLADSLDFRSGARPGRLVRPAPRIVDSLDICHFAKSVGHRHRQFSDCRRFDNLRDAQRFHAGFVRTRSSGSGRLSDFYDQPVSKTRRD